MTKKDVNEIAEVLERVSMNLKLACDQLIDHDQFQHRLTEYLLEKGRSNPKSEPAKQC